MSGSLLSNSPVSLSCCYHLISHVVQQEENIEEQPQSGTAGRSEKGLAGDWTGPEGTEVLKLSAEPPKIRGYSSQFDTGTKNSQTD